MIGAFLVGCSWKQLSFFLVIKETPNYTSKTSSGFWLEQTSCQNKTKQKSTFFRESKKMKYVLGSRGYLGIAVNLVSCDHCDYIQKCTCI